MIDFIVSDMTCASCVARVEKALRKVPGVIDATVNLATEAATIRADGPVAEAAIAAIRRAGYEAALRSAASEEAAKSVGVREGREVAFAALLTAPLVAPMVGELFGVHWMLPAWIQLLLATPVQFVLGWRFHVAAWKASR